MDVLERLRQHLRAKLGDEPLTCSVCHAEAWEVSAIVASPVSQHLTQAPGRQLYRALSESMPLVALICQNCFHVLQFAWKPIEATTKDRDSEAEAVQRALKHLQETGGR